MGGGAKLLQRLEFFPHLGHLPAGHLPLGAGAAQAGRARLFKEVGRHGLDLLKHLGGQLPNLPLGLMVQIILVVQALGSTKRASSMAFFSAFRAAAFSVSPAARNAFTWRSFSSSVRRS